MELETKELRPEQERLVRTLLMMVDSLSKAREEDAFFGNSAELMRLCAAVIKQSNFVRETNSDNKIPYTEQVLEYSIDVLQECMNTSKIISYDN
ncbi:MAG: hypothetical protein OXB84_06175 [Halobacteriovoraceae bacterium]|nr:hypothetical protein [Halobacteriovoraceae bacterium]